MKVSQFILHRCFVRYLIILTAALLAFTAFAPAQTARAQCPCDVATAKAAIDAARPIPVFLPPGPAFDAKKAKGKTILNIPENSANPFASGISAAMKQIAEKVGIKFIDYPNQSSHTQWIQGMNTAIAMKADVVTLIGGAIHTKYMLPQAKALHEKGIHIVSCVNEDLSQQKGEYVTARVGQPYGASAKLDADWIIANSNCDTEVLVIISAEAIAGEIEVNAIKNEFAKLAPCVKLTFCNAPLAEWSTKIAACVTPMVQARPKLKWILPLYDSMCQFVVPALKMAGGYNRVKIATFNGTPFVQKMMQDDPEGPISMNVGESLGWLGYATMDQAMRILAGAPIVESGDEHIPLRIFDKNNVWECGSPPTYDKGYGDPLPGYMKLWRLQ